VPGVLAGEPISLEQQLAQWEERKAQEKPRNSSMDDVPTGQPALALTQKVYERVVSAGLPADLVPDEMVSIEVGVGGDAENSLRSVTLEFMDTVRKVEYSIAASRRGEDTPEVLDISQLGTVSEEEWRAHWPTLVAESPAEPQLELELEPEPEPQLESELESEADEDADEDAVDEAEVPDEVTDEAAEEDAVAQAKSVEPQ
jgi:XTP/dITP diphosphohydrolase